MMNEQAKNEVERVKSLTDIGFEYYRARVVIDGMTRHEAVERAEAYEALLRGDV